MMQMIQNIKMMFEEMPILSTIFLVSIVGLIIVYGFFSSNSGGGSCDVPGCSNSASNKGQYGGHVYVCDEHKYVSYYIDPRDGSVNFYKGSY